jgi:hypothetical protein
VGFLDRAKKFANQAKDLADKAKDLADKARDGTEAGDASAPVSVEAQGAADPRMGTPYTKGMLGRPGWREKGLTDPAAVLPIAARDSAGIPHSTKSVIIEEPYGMGRRWSTGERSAALFYQLYPEHRAWKSPSDTIAFTEVSGSSTTSLPEGRALVFIGPEDERVVLELTGLAAAEQAQLARSVATQLDAR